MLGAIVKKKGILHNKTNFLRNVNIFELLTTVDKWKVEAFTL